MSDIYTLGGTVQAGGGVYIKRKADDELLALCHVGTFAYILTARQMGKSSLMDNTASELEQQGVFSIIIDLALIGIEAKDQDGWYRSILFDIEKKARLETNALAWWNEHQGITPTLRLMSFLETVLLAEIDRPIVIFVDEIDTTLSLKFGSDDFFIAIRSLYNARSRQPILKRLTFVLIGVATPSELIKDTNRTPFNIGEPIALTDFTLEEASPLSEGFPIKDFKQRRDLLLMVLNWTGGHPYLTQHVCAYIARQGEQSWDAKGVEAIIASLFFEQKRNSDRNLTFVANHLTKRARDSGALELYSQIRSGVKSVLVDPQSLPQAQLKLSGVVKESSDGRTLVVRNRIYENTFDRVWVARYVVSAREEVQGVGAPAVVTPERMELELRFKVFSEFCLNERYRTYQEVVNHSNQIQAQARGIQFWLGVALVVTSVALAVLGVVYSSGQGQCATVGAPKCTGINLILGLGIVLTLILPTLILFITALVQSSRVESRAVIANLARTDIDKIQRLTPLNEMDISAYRQSATKTAEYTLRVLALEAGQWGQLIRTPGRISDFIEGARNRSSIPLERTEDDSASAT